MKNEDQGTQIRRPGIPGASRSAELSYAAVWAMVQGETQVSFREPNPTPKVTLLTMYHFGLQGAQARLRLAVAKAGLWSCVCSITCPPPTPEPWSPLPPLPHHPFPHRFTTLISLKFRPENRDCGIRSFHVAVIKGRVEIDSGKTINISAWSLKEAQRSS